MSPTSISSQSLGATLIHSVTQAQSSLATAVTEETTGQYADLGLQLGDKAGYELSLKEEVQRLQALTAGDSLVTANLSGAQGALSAMSTSAQTTVNDLAVWTPSANSGAQLQTLGQSALQQLIASTNATAGDQYVFGGINSSVAPMADYFSTSTSAAKTAVDQAFQTTFGVLPTDPAASSITATQMQSFLTGPFAALFSGANWTANWSSASSTNTTAEIAPGEKATTSTNANAPAFSDLAQAYTMLAEFGGSKLSASAQQAVASVASSLITQGQHALTDTQAALGATQSQMIDATNAMGSQITLLQEQINGLDNVDQNAVAAQIASLTNQIQMAYELTARLQQLNLAQYLPVA